MSDQTYFRCDKCIGKVNLYYLMDIGEVSL
nr:MAG TPA: hypothetical protein [Caudoviricetes sp.]